jgi:CubicO group peptidase (beta-lactamase class C family)
MALDPKLGLQLVVLAVSLGMLGLAMAAPASGKSAMALKLQPFVDDGTIAGVVVLAADKDKILSLDAVGYEDLAAKTPMRPDSLFWIASQSKSITAAALMMLVDEGKVNVDDPVEKYLPEFHGQMVTAEHDASHMLLKPPAHLVTVRNLLTHTSGLPFASPLEQPTLDILPLSARVHSYAMLPLQYEPGSKYQYSNAGINTVGRIIEVVSGMPYEDFLQQRLLDPLGMTDTTFWPNAEQQKRLAKSYAPNHDHTALVEVPIGQLLYPLDDRVHRAPMPAGGLFSTATDIARFCQMVLNGGQLNGRRYLSEKDVHQMTTKQTPAPLGEEYGFGWGTGSSYGHGGAFKTSMNIDPRLGLITVFMVQSAGWRDEQHGNLVPAIFNQEATHRAALAAAGTVLVHEDFHQPAPNLAGKMPTTGAAPWSVNGNDDCSITVSGSQAVMTTGGGEAGKGTILAALPFTAQPGKLHALMVTLHFSQPVKADAWVGVGFCDAAWKKGPWMLVRPQGPELGDGQMVGFTDNDLHVACRGAAYAPLYPDITATVTWDTATNECRYYVNNILQGSAVLPAPPAVDRLFFQGFQTGATVTVKDVRLTVQPPQ